MRADPVAAALAVSPEVSVAIRPHIRRKGDVLYFLISRHPLLELCAIDKKLYDALDGQTRLSSLLETFSNAAAALAHWYQLEIVEFVPPKTLSGDHLVVIEPHMDDAALSAGGSLALRAGTSRITILSATRRSNVSGYWSLGRDFFAADEVTALREAESQLAAALVGGSHRSLDRADAPLRYQPESRWNLKDFPRLHDGLSSFLACRSPPAAIDHLASALGAALADLQPDELWIPFGVGGHIDHCLTRDACMALLSRRPQQLESVPVYAYEDHPYSTYFPEQLEEMVRVYAEGGLTLAEERRDVSATFEQKLRQVSVFASQFKIKAMQPALQAHAARFGGHGLVERLFRLQGVAHVATASRLAPDWRKQGILRSALQPWIAQRERIDRLVVIAGAPFGCYADCVERLLQAFPAAHVHVYADRDRAWDTGDRRQQADRLTLEYVPSGRANWIAASEREAQSGACPTVFVRFVPWPKSDAWREQILKQPHPPDSLDWHRQMAARLGARPIIFCRHLSDVSALASELVELVAADARA